MLGRVSALFAVMRHGGKSWRFRLSIVSLSFLAQFFDINGCCEKCAATRLVHETKPLAELAEKEVDKHGVLLSMKVVTGAVHIVLSGALLMFQE
ncbi:hypothetical protein C2L65_06475 [Paraburkholderia terrae]|uniref:Uncharacterized protein n=1 Tax=Paraburkholderia terrae TaxID=311230 RepID=A0A2I8EIP2_9BURK|nr:hypothetical protein C2L65_06475 [Paraburkholderia terrae]